MWRGPQRPSADGRRGGSCGAVRAFVSLGAGDLFAFGRGAPQADPDDPLSRLSVEALEASLKGVGGKLRFVKADSRHLTLKFLGNLEAQRAREVSQALEGASKAFHPFPVGARGVGFFPNALRPKVIWVGLEDPAAELKRLHAAVEEALGPLGLGEPGEAFVPHVTVARVVEAPPGPALAQAVDPLVHTRFGWTQAEGLDFWESTLTKGGPVYRRISHHAFRAPAP